MKRIVRIGLVASMLAVSPALAQGMPGSTVGLTATGLPSDPFASNYPSSPPPRMRPDRPEGSVRHRATARRVLRAPRSAYRLRPPADIPSGRPRR